MLSVDFPGFSPCESINMAAENLVAVFSIFSTAFLLLNVNSIDVFSPNLNVFRR